MNQTLTIITLTVLGPCPKGHRRNTRSRSRATGVRRAMMLVRPNDPPAHLRKRLTDSVMRLGGGAVCQVSRVIDAIFLELRMTDAPTGTHNRHHWTLDAAWDDLFADPYDRPTVRMRLMHEPPLKTHRQEPSPTRASRPTAASLHRVGLS